jgi:sulfur carrier protein ThiS adenylyltransferase
MKNFEKEFFAKHDPEILPVLRAGVIGIAGAGGLGSNAAVALARAGIGKLIIADHDRIEISNLNRQQYFWAQIGKVKVRALLENLRKISPFSEYVGHHVRLTPKNIPRIFKTVEVMIEAFDLADQKEMLLETWISHFPDKPIIMASGLSGFGKNEKLRTRKIGNVFICGDEESEAEEGISPMAPRVGIVANMQANLALELLVKAKRK